MSLRQKSTKYNTVHAIELQANSIANLRHKSPKFSRPASCHVYFVTECHNMMWNLHNTTTYKTQDT